MTIRSPQALRLMLDNIMSGMSWKNAMACVGSRSESAGWTWKHKSKEAEAAGDTSSVFFLDWPAGSAKQWFHILCDVARDRRGALLATPLLRGEFAIVDGKIAFQTDDFGGIVFDDLGVPEVERVVLVEPPTPRPWKLRREGPPRPELAPSSYSGHKPREVPVPAFVGSALGDYLKANTPKSRPITELERDLREKLAAGPKNSKPSAPVHIIRDQPGDAQQEHVNQPSNETGLPRTAEVSRAPASPPAYARPPRLDGARVPPPGGFRVR
jgi:hypothetical protein